jgi:hypothetical protein
MNAQERQAVLEGTQAAQRLHAELDTRAAVERGDLSRVDVFAAAQQLGAVLLFKRLKGLLGAYFANPVSPVPGIIVSTERDLNVQRFTAAHEIGHLYMQHSPSLDEEVGLWRGPSRDLRELAADAFASEFLLPKWLYVYHAGRHQWKTDALHIPAIVYQLSLRLGASYDATCWGLQGHKILTPATVNKLRDAEPKRIKRETLAGLATLPNPWANVWVITTADDGLTFEGDAEDLILFRCPEHPSAGYVWDEASLEQQGFELLGDARDTRDSEDCGGMATRVFVTRVSEPREYRVSIAERRPWDPEDVAGKLSVSFDMFGKEEGLPRLARRAIAAA